MLSVVIPTLNSQAGLARCLTSLVPAVVDGLVSDVIVVDGGSSDRTLKIADQAGTVTLQTHAGRGHQLKFGAQHAKGPWLLFLHSDTVLDSGWEREVGQFIEKVDTGRRDMSAAAFRFVLDDDGVAPRLLETLVGFRAGLL